MALYIIILTFKLIQMSFGLTTLDRISCRVVMPSWAVFLVLQKGWDARLHIVEELGLNYGVWYLYIMGILGHALRKLRPWQGHPPLSPPSPLGASHQGL